MADLNQVQLPNGGTYNFKDTTQTRSDHRHYESDLIPLIHKTYASTSYYATNSSWDNSTWYFMSVKPNSWYTPWKVRFKVHSFCPAYANVDSITWATVCGRADSVIYANWNERYDPAHYYTTYYVLKKAGFDAGYGHAIGVSILYGTGYTTAAYYRTFEVDYFECENCTVTILDTPVKWASWPGTGTTNYNGLNSMNAVDRGLQESGDADTIDSRMSYFCGRTGSKGIWAGSLFMEDSSNTYQNICTATDGTATNSNRTTGTKIANTSGFKPFTKVYYCGGNYNPNSDINGWGAVYSECGLFDARYAFNVTLTANSLTPYKPIYLVGTINSSDGLFYLDSTWWTQTPTTTSKVYVLVGSCYDSTTSNCRINLYEHNTWYKYDGSKLVEISGDARSVNGYTVNKSVPSNAVFTDTTYTDGTGMTLKDNEFNVGKRWKAVTQGLKWSRIYYAVPVVSTVGCSGLLSINCTRGSVVCNATFLVTSSHAGSKYANCIELSSNNYTPIHVRLVAKNNGEYYFEIYDEAASIASGTTQEWNCCYIPLGDTTLTMYTTFTDGSTIPSGYSELNNFTTTNASEAVAVKSISRSGTTFTATRQDGSTFTFTQQDNNTTYTFTGGNDGFTVTPSGGSAQTVNVSAYRLNSSDTRSDNQLPSWYMTNYPKSVVEEFKRCANIGVNSLIAGEFCTLTTFVVWANNSGGRPVQLALSDTGVIAKRVATADNAWGTWTALPTTDTKNTAGSTDTSSKIYLIGATSQAANPQTYSDNEVYATSGVLTTKSVQVGGGSCTLQYNSTTKSIDFVFT